MGSLPSEPTRLFGVARERIAAVSTADLALTGAALPAIALAVALAFTASPTVRVLAALGLLVLGVLAGLLGRSRLAGTGMRHTLQRVAAAVDSLEVGLLVLDEHGRPIVANAALRAAAGTRLLSDGADSPMTLALTGNPISGEATVTVTGHQRRLFVRAQPLLGPSGERLGALGTVLDVTAERQARSDLDAVLHARRTVLADGDVRAAVCRAASESTGAMLTILFEVQDRTLVATAQDGVPLEDLRFDIGSETVVAQTYRTARTRIVPTLHAEPHYAARQAERLEQSSGHHIGAVAYLPLLADGRCRGVLVTVLAASVAAPSAATILVLEQLAGETVLALERDELRSALEEQARTDPLTNLANRRALPDHLAHLPRAGGIAVLDLDHFGEYNRLHGEPSGDSLLVLFAEVLQSTLRSEDIPVRLGGQDFAVLVPEGGTLPGLLNRLRLAWAAQDSGVTFSAGIAAHHRGGSVKETMRLADEACAAAKRAGRDRTHSNDGQSVPAVLTPLQLRALQHDAR